MSFTDGLMYRVKSSGKNNILTEAFAAPAGSAQSPAAMRSRRA